MRQKVPTFIVALMVWIIFAGKITFEIIVSGVVASLVTTLLFSEMLFRKSNQEFNFLKVIKRLFYTIFFIPVFFYEALLAAIKVSRHVFEREPSFAPGIVMVKTELTNISAITILAHLITLTPGTLTLDFDRKERAYYIHWIDVKTKEEAEARKEIIERFERWLDVIFK